MNSEHEIIFIKLISQIFNHDIRNSDYFISAITHKCTSTNNYERLEILGDSVLQLSITELLFIKYPQYSEGQITVIRQKLVNANNLKEIFLSLKLENIFKQMNPKFIEGNIYSDIFESLLGALFLDSNYKTTRDVINKIFMPLITDDLVQKDSKTLLQEYMHSKNIQLPIYSTSIINDKDHKYLITCELLDLNIKESIPSNKVKPAEQKLAHIILNKLNEKN